MPESQGYELEVGSLRWFYREATPTQAEDRPPVLLLHGLPSQSYSWNPILNALAQQGIRAIAPDWIGFGLSAKPEVWEFSYKPAAYLKALEDWLEVMELERFSLVVQGFLGSVGLLYALQHPDRIERLMVLNTPLTTAARLPWKIQQLGLPLVGEMITQDPLLIDRTLEGGGLYQVPDGDLDVYRRPYLKASDAGRALLATVRNLQLKQVTQQIETGFQDWSGAMLVAWGLEDPWLPISIAEQFQQGVPKAELIKLPQLGHYPQQDWHQKVEQVLIPFLRRWVV